MGAEESLSDAQFNYPRVEGLELSQRAAVDRFRVTRGVSVGGATVKISAGQRNKIRSAQTREDVESWGSVQEPGINPNHVQSAAEKYGLMGPHDTLGRTVLRAYGREKV